MLLVIQGSCNVYAEHFVFFLGGGVMCVEVGFGRLSAGRWRAEGKGFMGFGKMAALDRLRDLNAVDIGSTTTVKVLITQQRLTLCRLSFLDHKIVIVDPDIKFPLEANCKLRDCNLDPSRARMVSTAQALL